MKLSKNSWHYKLYCTTFSTLPPNNLCPYFWKMVLACILFIPYTIWFIPTTIFKKLDDNDTKAYPNYYEDFAMSIAINILTSLLISMVVMFWHLHPTKGDVSIWLILGIIGWALTIGLVINGIINIAKDWCSNRNKGYDPKGNRIKKKPNIIKAFIKAKIEKNCPIIDWE